MPASRTFETSQRVRVAALKYLALLPDFIRYDVLHPHKAHVLKELGKVLDDPKRVVRKEAVATRFVFSSLVFILVLMLRHTGRNGAYTIVFHQFSFTDDWSQV